MRSVKSESISSITSPAVGAAPELGERAVDAPRPSTRGTTATRSSRSEPTVARADRALDSAHRRAAIPISSAHCGGTDARCCAACDEEPEAVELVDEERERRVVCAGAVRALRHRGGLHHLRDRPRPVPPSARACRAGRGAEIVERIGQDRTATSAAASRMTMRSRRGQSTSPASVESSPATSHPSNRSGIASIGAGHRGPEHVGQDQGAHGRAEVPAEATREPDRGGNEHAEQRGEHRLVAHERAERRPAPRRRR